MAATRIGSARVPHTPFNATNATIYHIGVHTALGDPGTALAYARTIDLRTVPTPERQARFCLDTARAWNRFGNTSAASRPFKLPNAVRQENSADRLYVHWLPRFWMPQALHQQDFASSPSAAAPSPERSRSIFTCERPAPGSAMMRSGIIGMFG